MIPAKILAQEGLSCEELLTVNFQTNKQVNLNRTLTNDGNVLKEYARDVISLRNSLDSDDSVREMATNAAAGLLHEAYYVIITEGRNFSVNLGLTNVFVMAMALEAIAEHFMSCPLCGGPLGGEHLQHRGDLYCKICHADIDVKTSRAGAKKHCVEYNKKSPKSIRTQYATYLKSRIMNGKEGYLQLWAIDCLSGIEFPASLVFPKDLYDHVAWLSLKLVTPYLPRIKELGDQF